MRIIRILINKHNERILKKKGFIPCAYCKKTIHKTDNYCMYCGEPTGIKKSPTWVNTTNVEPKMIPKTHEDT